MKKPIKKQAQKTKPIGAPAKGQTGSPAKREEYTAAEGDKVLEWTEEENARTEVIHALLDRNRQGLTLAYLLEQVNLKLKGRYSSCSVKTLRRALDLMKEADMPLEYDRPQKAWRYTGQAQLPAHRLDTSCVMHQGNDLGVLLGKQALGQFAGTPLHEELEPVFRALEAAVPARVRTQCDRLMRFVYFPALPPVKAIPTQFWRKIEQAIENRRAMTCLYQAGSGGRAEARTVEPYALLILGQKWYLLARDCAKDKVLTLALLRISQPEVLTRTFEIPEDFNLDVYMSDTVLGFPSTGPKEKVVLRLAKDGALPWLETQWHPQEKRTVDAEGRTLIAFETAGGFMALPKVLESAGKVEVLEPAHLRLKAREMGRAVMEGHG